MTADEVEEYISRIAFSGATDFIEKYKDKSNDDQIIGHFGLGFYSAFMVADEVTIDTLSYKEGSTPVHWSCDGGTEYNMEDGDMDDIGTEITLYLNDDCLEFANEYRSTRVLNLSMTSVQLSETTSKDWVLGFGYKIQDFNLFSRTSKRRVKGSGSSSARDQQDSKQTKSSRRGFSHDLDLRLDVSYRRQAAINRDIMSMTSTATSGNNAFKLSFSADYTMSRLLTMSFYLDRQTNKPLLSNNSYL